MWQQKQQGQQQQQVKEQQLEEQHSLIALCLGSKVEGRTSATALSELGGLDQHRCVEEPQVVKAKPDQAAQALATIVVWPNMATYVTAAHLSWCSPPWPPAAQQRRVCAA